MSDLRPDLFFINNQIINLNYFEALQLMKEAIQTYADMNWSQGVS